VSVVRLEHEDGVGVVVIDNPPINAGSTMVRRGLLAAIEEIEADPSLTAGVLIGAGSTFIAGSDIREFGAPLETPELPQVIEAIEAAHKPFVAAIHGAALGGGYELALGCDLRIVAPDAVVGLPEVTLGMIPGAGGTQRVPRLVGPAAAISLIASGRRVEADEAVAAGLVDLIAEGDLRTAAVASAKSIRGKAPVRDRVAPADDEDAIRAAEEKAVRAGRGRPPVLAAVRAVRDSVDRPFSEALAAERQVFTTLRGAPEAAALRHLFFAERLAGKGPGIDDVKPVLSFGVVGAGTMGCGIAAAALRGGLDVVLVDTNGAAVERARTSIDVILGRWLSRGEITADAAADMGRRLTLGTELDLLTPCDAVVEAIIEQEDAKATLLNALSDVLGPEALIATNTSYLDVDRLAQYVTNKARFVGLHFFNPAQSMRLVEVVKAECTSDQVVAQSLKLVRSLTKLPVVTHPGFGFIGNRIYAAYRRTCELMVEDGAWPEEVDAALERFGFALGPFATGDMSGLDIAWAMRKATRDRRDPAVRHPVVADRLCEMGRFGRKTGAGWYAYPDRAGRGVPDPEVHDIILAESAAQGIKRQTIKASQIVEHVLASILREALAVVEEGVARNASDVDVVLVNGYGFPRHEGGPLWWADRQGEPEIRRILAASGLADADAVVAMISRMRGE
jgi:3-hydroxyacyl-CoA dehydrogenase